MEPKKNLRTLVLSASIASVFSLLLIFGFMSNAELKLQDALYGGDVPLKNIIIVAIDDKSIQEIGRWPWNRSVFAELIDKLAPAKVIAFDIVFSEQSTPVDDDALAKAISESGKVILSAEFGSFQKTPEGFVPREALLPIDIFRNGSGIGIINLASDQDGFVRSANNEIKSDYQLFAAAVAKRVVDSHPPRESRLIINMVGPRGSFTTVSVIDVLSGNVDPALLKNAIVLIGATAPDLHDDYQTATSGGTPVPGVEIQANLVQTILSKRYLHYEPTSFTILGVFAIASLVAALLLFVNTWVAAILALVAAVIYLFVAAALFSYGWLIDVLYLPLCALFVYGGNVASLYLLERAHKKQVIDAFRKYVAPEIVGELMKHPEKLKLGGERREITIFFSDVRGFTTLSEQLTPEELVKLLNEYLTAMTDIIMASGGVVDKYIGDAIMAFWGAPLDQPDHAERAAKATIEMIAALGKLQEKWKSEGVPTLEIGAGMNTGQAVIGNMGSHQRFNYTCMGDTINLGSRLEGLTKEYGATAIVSETTRKQLPVKFVVRELDIVRVKGKKEPIKIFELVGISSALDDTVRHKLEHFSSGLVKYRSMKFKEAIVDFERAAHEGDKPSKMYIGRCEHFIEEHPGKEWDCVWTMKTK